MSPHSHPTVRALDAELEALWRIDPLMLYEWSRPRIDQLHTEFYLGDRPVADFEIWLRERFLTRQAERV